MNKETYGLAAAEVMRDISPDRKLLEDAADVISGERLDQYGQAEDSFEYIADAWSAFLRARGYGRVPLTASDVALMMAQFKIMREANAPKRDNRLDAVGYIALGERAIEKSNTPKA